MSETLIPKKASGRRPNESAATLERIAAECGLSVHTVSRVLNGKLKETWPAKIAQAERVRKIALRMGYRPNLAARSMRSSRFFNIGYFLAVHPRSETVSHQSDEAGVCERAAQNDFHVSLIRLPREAGQAGAIPKALREACIDGLIVANFISLPDEVKRALEESPYPIVYLNENAPENAVSVDDFQGATLAVEHLLAQGYRRIAFWKIKSEDQTDHYSVIQRERAYREALTRAGLPTAICVGTNANHEDVFEENLRTASRPDAVFCNEDVIALLAQRVALRTGMQLPKDLGIVGFNNDHVGRYAPIPLTTVAVPFFDMGVAAAEMLIAMVNSGQRTHRSVVLSPKLVVRESAPGPGRSR